MDRNRAILKRFVHSVCHIAIREHGFHGNDESESSTVQGSFKDQLSILSKYDTLLQLRMSSASVFVVTQETKQKDLIFELAESITGEIKSELYEARFVSVGIDETTEYSV